MQLSKVQSIWVICFIRDPNKIYRNEGPWGVIDFIKHFLNGILCKMLKLSILHWLEIVFNHTFVRYIHKMYSRTYSCNLFNVITMNNTNTQLSILYQKLVMCQTPFYRTMNELKHHFSNIERTRKCSSTGHWTRTPYFWLWTIEHPT